MLIDGLLTVYKVFYFMMDDGERGQHQNDRDRAPLRKLPMIICLEQRSQTVSILKVIVKRWLMAGTIAAVPPTVEVRGDFGVTTVAVKIISIKIMTNFIKIGT